MYFFSYTTLLLIHMDSMSFMEVLSYLISLESVERIMIASSVWINLEIIQPMLQTRRYEIQIYTIYYATLYVRISYWAMFVI